MENKWMLLISFFLVGGLCLLVGMNITENTIVYEDVEVEKEQPMLLVTETQWQGNIDDDSEIFFDYFIYNFGNVEAKNITIRCEITNGNEDIIKKKIFKIGNIASNSYEYQQSTMKYSEAYLEDRFGGCYLESANGDYINLRDRLFNLV